MVSFQFSVPIGGKTVIAIFLAFPPYMAPGRPPYSDFFVEGH